MSMERAAAIGLIGAACSLTTEAPPLEVVDSQPESRQTLPANQALRLTFDRYLATPPLVPSPDQTYLRSGENVVGVELGYDPVSLAVIVAPVLELSPGRDYQLVFGPDAVVALDGTRLPQAFELTFTASPAVALAAVPAKPDFARDILPLLTGRCGCHGPSPQVFPELVADALIGKPSARQPGLNLVEPGLPLRSQLVRKLLRDYPATYGETMPPGSLLPDDDVRLVVSWVSSL